MKLNDWLVEAYFWKFRYDINFNKDSIYMKIFNENDYA